MAEQSRSKHRTLIIGLTIFGCLLILFFGARVFHAFKKFQGHPPPPLAVEEIETDAETIEDWMTLPFISHAYGVPPELLFNSLNIPPQGNQKKSLKELNDEFYPEAEGFVVATVKATVSTHQSPPQPEAPPKPGAPPTATLQTAPTP